MPKEPGVPKDPDVPKGLFSVFICGEFFQVILVNVCRFQNIKGIKWDQHPKFEFLFSARS